MILSNNPGTYINIIIYHENYGTEIFYHKYTYRWSGPSAVYTPKQRSILWKNSNIKLRSNLWS